MIKDDYSTYSSTNKSHKQIDRAREEERHDDALELAEKLRNEYEKKGDFEGLSQVLQSRVLVYKHLYLISKNQKYIALAEKDAKESLSIAEKHKLNTVLGCSHFRLGEIAMLKKDYNEAATDYKKALNLYTGTNAERGDYRYHLGEAIYVLGSKKKGKEIILQGLKEIRENSSEINPFLLHVWESGCYMRLADLLKDDNPEEAEEYLSKAQSIVDSDKKLIIRKRQIEELTKKLFNF